MEWERAPDGEVLLPRGCPARDADGQGCAFGTIHLRPHRSSGLRAWLETGTQDALIRAYEPADAERVEAMEAPLFAAFGFAPIARQDLVRTKTGGISFGFALVLGPLLAPNEDVEFHVRLVCFARPASRDIPAR